MTNIENYLYDLLGYEVQIVVDFESGTTAIYGVLDFSHDEYMIEEDGVTIKFSPDSVVKIVNNKIYIGERERGCGAIDNRYCYDGVLRWNDLTY